MFAVLRKKASLWGAFFIAWISAAPALALCPAPVPASVSEVVVRQVVDGDTLRLKDGRRVRLIGINAPELSGAQRTPEPYAEAARDRLRQLVAENGGRLGLVASGKDRYGRTLGHVFGRGGNNLEAQLLSEGLGYFVAFAPRHAWQACQQQAEARARAARVGLWRSAAALSPERIRQGGFALVEGRLAKIEQNRGGLWLQLDGPLVLRIEPDVLAHFDIPAMRALVGRRVAVRGWVVDRRRDGAGTRGQSRWMLLLTDPAMLQALP